MVMLKKIDFKMLLVAVAALSVGVLTMLGTVQQVIKFADPLNEMLFAFMAMMVGFMCLIGIKK